MSHTELSYLNDTYVTEAQASVIRADADDRGAYIVLDRTVMYPQGGGQEADHGTLSILESVHVIGHVAFIEGEVRHYAGTATSTAAPVGATVAISVDRQRRLRNAALHSSGHLLTHVIEDLFAGVMAIKGYHFDEGPHVEFSNEGEVDLASALLAINDRLKADIASGLDISAQLMPFDVIAAERPHLASFIPRDKPSRIVAIGNYPALPCGGTHLGGTAELGGVVVTKVKTRKGASKVSYEVRGGGNAL